MNVLAVSALLAGVLLVAIGTAVLLRSRHHRIYRLFAAFAFSIAVWHIFTFLSAATSRPIMRWLALWAAASIPPIAVSFYRAFLAQPSIGGQQKGPRVTLAWTILAYAALIYSAIITSIHDRLWFTVPFGVYVFGGLYRCVFDMYLQYRNTVKAVEKARIWYLTLGGFIATTLTLTDVLPRFGVAWPALGNVLGVLYLYFLSQTLFRNRLIDLNELIGKMAVLGTLVVLLSAVYGVLLYWIGSGQKGLYLLNALVASFVILILFEPVRIRLESGINRWLWRQRHALRGRIEAVRRDLPGSVDVADMVSRIMQALEESGRVTDASVFLLDADGQGYDRAAYLGRAPVERIEASADRAMLDRVRSGYLDVELLRHEHARTANEQLWTLITRIDELHATLLVPLLGTGETEQGVWLLGLLCLSDDRVDGAFDPDDVDMFRQLALAAARVIESSQAYERVKERDRLAALGEMAAGLAHEIRNPLGAIKGAAQLLIPPTGAPPTEATHAETRELLEIIVEEANRLNNVVTRFLDYARLERPPREHAGTADITTIVRRTLQLISQRPDMRGIELRPRLDECLPKVQGDPDALLQVLLNLAINAIQAMPEGGLLEIVTSRRRRSPLGYGQFVEVRIRDSGAGIPRDRLKKLFIPFFTTKSQGTGLGLAISQRIIHQHGGTIDVRSTPGQGATFAVYLPALEERVTSAGERPAPLPEPAEASPPSLTQANEPAPPTDSGAPT